MAFVHEVDKIVEQELGNRNRRLSEIEAFIILETAQKCLNLPVIHITFLNSNRRSYLARANIKGGVRSISKTPAGMDVCTLLHEIAHHMPGGWEHGANWTWNFFKIVQWFRNMDCQGKFKVSQAVLDEYE